MNCAPTILLITFWPNQPFSAQNFDQTAHVKCRAATRMVAGFKQTNVAFPPVLWRCGFYFCFGASESTWSVSKSSFQNSNQPELGEIVNSKIIYIYIYIKWCMKMSQLVENQRCGFLSSELLSPRHQRASDGPTGTETWDFVKSMVQSGGFKHPKAWDIMILQTILSWYKAWDTIVISWWQSS